MIEHILPFSAYFEHILRFLAKNGLKISHFGRFLKIFADFRNFFNKFSIFFSEKNHLFPEKIEFFPFLSFHFRNH
jgi:hypothetical protein